MKRRFAALGLLVSLAASAQGHSLTLKIDGWHSKGDAFKTEVEVKKVKGVRSATTDFAKKELVVMYDDAVAKQPQIEKAVADAGYAVAR